MKALIILLCSFLVVINFSYAGDGTWVKKTPITSLVTGQYTIFEPQRASGEDTRSYNKLRAFVRLNYTRKLQSDRTHNYDWNLNVNFNYLVNGVNTVGSVVVKNEASARVYEDYQEIPLPDEALGCAVTITSVTASYGALNAGATTSAPSPQTSAFIPDDIDFILELRSERVYNLNTSTASLDDISRISFTPADYKLYWDFQQGAEEYDLEWVFVDKYSPEYNQIAATAYTPNELSGFTLPFELLEPTRVRVWGNSYQLDKTYPEGTLYFRVRSVSTFADQVNGISDDIRLGKWGYMIHSITVTLNKYEITNAQEFDSTKTWLYGISYADDGKSVSTLTYYDGSNRGRQNLTYNTSDNVTLVGESKYDNEGRQAVSVVPAPVTGRNLLYQSNFNMVGSSVFDETEIEEYIVPPLSTSSGAAKYFSPSNSFTTDLFRDAIPNANGYVFSQTLFRNDGTGRIERVGGIGQDFQARGDHAARTWYGSTNVVELKRLFGDNVGDVPQGYRKDMVRDANGQLSVTYYDKRGNTIATALAGDAPTALRKLNYTEETIQTPLNDNNVKIGNSMISEHTFLNTVSGNTITLDYTLDAVAQEIASQVVVVDGHEISLGAFCPDCRYNLRIEVKNQNGVPLPGTPFTESFYPGAPCEDEQHYTSTGHSVTLPEPGEYRIIKTLTVDEESMIAAFQAQLDAQGTSSFDSFLQEYLTTVDFTACFTECEDLCEYSVRLDYIQQHGQAAWDALSKSEMIALVNACITSECGFENHYDPTVNPIEVDPVEGCEAQRQRMIDQISPGGVLYDDHSSSLWNSVDAAIGSGSISIGGTSYTVADLQDPTKFTSQVALVLLPYHREFCIWNNHCPTWMKVQNASLDITTIIMSTAWPTSAPSSGVFYQPYNSAYDHANDAFGMLSLLTARVNSFGTLNDLPIYSDCNNNWSAVNSGNLYAVVNAMADRIASQSDCDGDPLTAAEIEALKKQLFLGLYLKIKWGLVKELVNCPFYDDQDAIFMLPSMTYASMNTIVQDAINNTVNQKTCHEKAIDNVNIWMSGLSSTCLSAIGISSFTTIAPYGSPDALALQSAYSASSTSGGLVQLFYNYSRSVCEATTAPSPVNPNVLGLFYDPDPTNSITNAPGEVQYDAIKSLLATTGCDYNTTVNLPFEVTSPTVPTPIIGGYQTNQSNLNLALNTLAESVITCTTCPEELMYWSLTNFRYYVKKINNISLPNGLTGSVRYARPDHVYNAAYYPNYNYAYSWLRYSHYLEFELSDGTCTFKTRTFDTPDNAVNPNSFEANFTPFAPGYSSIILNEFDYYYGDNSPFNTHFPLFYGNTNIANDLELYIFPAQEPNYFVTTNRNEGNNPILLDRECGGAGLPSGGLGGSFETVIDLIPYTASQLENDCMQSQINQATADAQVMYDQVIEDLWSQFYEKMKSCLVVTEDFTMSYKLKEYQYTLYYYDLAGNLVQTIPPQGVKPFTSDEVNTYLNDGVFGDRYPSHDMETRYMYNGLNALIASFTPDGGKTDLYLDKLYRVRFSQNAQQKIDNKASYSKYDELGRVMEAGEFINMNSPDLNTKTDDDKFPKIAVLDYIHTFYETGYNAPVSSAVLPPYPSTGAADATLTAAFGTAGQENLRNAIGAVMHRQAEYYPDGSVMNGTEVITVLSYSYDPHKNVKKMVSTNNHLASIGMQHKRTDYKYDLISGNTEEVWYQKGASDEYRHRYHYDANNRLVRTYTSHNGDFWELDAKYFYYLHGSLARRELGHDQVQGTDYAYNLQGWLKGVNSTTLDRTRDIGKDGNTGTDNQYFGIDAFGFSLGYFTNDYQALKDAAEGTQVTTNDYFAGTDAVSSQNLNTDDHALGLSMGSLYNGNITHMVTAMRDNSEGKIDILANNYQYDQLQRIRQMKVYFAPGVQTSNDFTGADLFGISSGQGAFQESYTFDKNGNLQTLQRNGSGINGAALPMDNFRYLYYTQIGGATVRTNRLRSVTDLVTDTYSGDIEPNQGGTNYQYNANGQLTRDIQEGIDVVKWTVTGKVKEFRYSNGDHDVKFFYDPMDRRVAKMEYENPEHTSIKWTYYTYDAGGNVMATYKRTRKYVNTTNNLNNYTDEYLINDHLIYGADRLGSEGEYIILFSEKYTQTSTSSKDVEIAPGWNMVVPPRGATPPDYTRRLVGDKRYELANHLGNVLEVITDRKVRFTDNSVLVYSADVVSYSDYSPYGTLLDGRHGNDDTYRYGFQGQERDDEIKGDGNSYNYEYRMHDPRIGRFFATDPLEAKYSYYSPYQFSGNRLIDSKELEGLEPQNVTYYNMEKQGDGSYARKEVYKSSDIILKAADIRFKNLSSGKYYFMEPNHNPKGTFWDTETIHTDVYTYWNSDGSMKRQVVTNADNYMKGVVQSTANEVPEEYNHVKLYYKTTAIKLGDTGLGYSEYASSVYVYDIIPISIASKDRKSITDDAEQVFNIGLDIRLDRLETASKTLLKSRSGFSSVSLGDGSGRIYNRSRIRMFNFGLRGAGIAITAYSIYQTESGYNSGRVSSARRKFNHLNTGIGSVVPLPFGIAIGLGDYWGQKNAPAITTSIISEGGFANTIMKSTLEALGHEGPKLSH